MRVFLSLLFLISIVAAPAISVQRTNPQAAPPADAKTIPGRWRVKFTLVGGREKNLVFEASGNGTGLFRLLDTGLDDKPVPLPHPAVWSLTNGHLSISGEAELPIGTCCRETGTVIFKAKLKAADSISGKLIFVTNIDEEESPYKYRSTAGVFTATRISDK